jgi:thioredoxin 1
MAIILTPHPALSRLRASRRGGATNMTGAHGYSCPRRKMAGSGMTTTKISDTSFETDVLKSGKPVLVDFWAEWCGPCKQIGPALEEIAKEYGDKITIAKLNIDENPGVPGKYGVRGIPTLMIFKDGQVAATKVGALPKGKIVEWIESAL